MMYGNGPYAKEQYLKKSLKEGEFLLYYVDFLKGMPTEKYEEWAMVAKRVSQVKKESGLTSVVSGGTVFAMSPDGFSKRKVASFNQCLIRTNDEEEARNKRFQDMMNRASSEEYKKKQQERAIERTLDELDYYGKINTGSASRYAARQRRRRFEKEDALEEED